MLQVSTRQTLYYVVDIYTFSIEKGDAARFIFGPNWTRKSKSIRNKAVTFNDNMIPYFNPKISYNNYRIAAANSQ